MRTASAKDRAADSASPAVRHLSSLLNENLTRHRFLRAGAEVFEERGIDDARVEDILQRAEAARSTFYEYFDNKMDLLKALHEVSTRLLYDHLVGAVSDADEPGELIRALVDALLEFQQQGGDLVSLLMTESIRSESPLTPVRKRFEDRLVEYFTTLLRDRMGREADPLMVRTLLMATRDLLLYLRDGGPMDEAAARRARSVLVPLFERGLPPEPDDDADDD